MDLCQKSFTDFERIQVVLKYLEAYTKQFLTMVLFSLSLLQFAFFSSKTQNNSRSLLIIWPSKGFQSELLFCTHFVTFFLCKNIRQNNFMLLNFQTHNPTSSKVIINNYNISPKITWNS